MKKPYDERESENKSGSFMSKFFSKFRKSDKQETEPVAADAQSVDTAQSVVSSVDTTQNASFEPAPIQPSPVQSSTVQADPVQSDTTQQVEETVAASTFQAQEPAEVEAPIETNDTASVIEAQVNNTPSAIEDEQEALNEDKAESVEPQETVKEDITESAEPQKAEKKAKAPSKPRAKKAAPAVDNTAEQKEEAPKPKQKFKVEKTGAYYQSDDSFMRFGGKSDLNSELFSTSFDIGDNKKNNK